MKVNSNISRDISFNGFWSSKFAKKGLEFASNNGALFAATTTLALSTGVRTVSILSTPKTEKENKKIACAKSITSGILEFVLTLAISMPIAAAFKKIDSNPAKYLKQSSIDTLKDGCANLKDSKAYSLATQMFKLGLGFAVVLPKALLTATGIPIVMGKILDKKNNAKKEEKKSLTFEGKANESFAKGLGKILDSKFLQEFSKNHKESNFPMHIFALKDVFATASFAFVTAIDIFSLSKITSEPFLLISFMFFLSLLILLSNGQTKKSVRPVLGKKPSLPGTDRRATSEVIIHYI